MACRYADINVPTSVMQQCKQPMQNEALHPPRYERMMQTARAQRASVLNRAVRARCSRGKITVQETPVAHNHCLRQSEQMQNVRSPCCSMCVPMTGLKCRDRERAEQRRNAMPPQSRLPAARQRSPATARGTRLPAKGNDVLHVTNQSRKWNNNVVASKRRVNGTNVTIDHHLN